MENDAHAPTGSGVHAAYARNEFEPELTKRWHSSCPALTFPPLYGRKSNGHRRAGPPLLMIRNKPDFVVKPT
jgi:hypothetical protein